MSSADNETPNIWKFKKGNIKNESFEDFRGESDSISTSFVTVWGEGTIYNFPTVASQMTVSSSSANDASAGTGLQTVLITYLDTNFEQKQELVTLNGQTAVNTVATDIYRINSCIGVTAGSTEYNEGIVYVGTGTVTAGKPATVYSHMIIGKSFAHNGVYTVPKDKAWTDLNIITSAEAGKQITFRTVTYNILGTGMRHVFFTAKDIIHTRHTDLQYNSTFLVPPGTDFRIDAKVLSGSGVEFSFIYNFLLHDKGTNE